MGLCSLCAASNTSCIASARLSFRVAIASYAFCVLSDFACACSIFRVACVHSFLAFSFKFSPSAFSGVPSRTAADFVPATTRVEFQHAIVTAMPDNRAGGGASLGSDHPTSITHPARRPHARPRRGRRGRRATTRGSRQGLGHHWYDRPPAHGGHVGQAAWLCGIPGRAEAARGGPWSCGGPTGSMRFGARLNRIGRPGSDPEQGRGRKWTLAAG